MASTADFRNGMVIEIDGDLWGITYFQHVKPGKGGAFVLGVGEESALDPQVVGPRVAEVLAGRGGGSGGLFQGKATRLSAREEAAAPSRCSSTER